MKAIYFIIILIAFLGCCRETQQEDSHSRDGNTNALLPDKVRVKHLFALKEDIDREWLKTFDRKEFLNIILDRALSEKIKVYDPVYNDSLVSISTDMIKSKLGAVQDTVYVENVITGELSMKVRNKDMDTEELTKLFFEEEWYFNKEKFRMEKHINNWCLIREYIRSDKRFVIKVFKVDQGDEKYSGKLKLFAENIKYEFSLDDTAGFNKYGYLKELNTKIFIDIIMDKVISGEVPVFDPVETDKQISPEQVKENFDAVTDTQYVENVETGELCPKIFEGKIHRDEIKSVIFIEDLYFDRKNFRIEKKVKGVIPVRHYYRTEDMKMTDTQKKMMFMVYFNTD